VTVRPAGPWVGDTVYDTTEQTWAVITDVRQRDVPRPVYVLRHPQVPGEQWTTEDPARLRQDRPR
jgi:hypothetical protein